MADVAAHASAIDTALIDAIYHAKQIDDHETVLYLVKIRKFLLATKGADRHATYGALGVELGATDKSL